MVGVRSRLASSGFRPTSVAWFGLRPEVRTTSPPAARMAPTVVIPTWPWGMVAASSSADTPSAHSTEAPVIPLGWVRIPRRRSSGWLRPPRATKASSGILSATVVLPGKF